MSFKVECPNCHGKAIIVNSANVGEGIANVFMKNLYCQCKKVKDCGCTFVVSASFSHYLNPPQRDLVDLAREILKQQEQLKLGV